MPRKHASKSCFLCERPLLKVEKYGCGSHFSDTPCWWVPTIKEHGLDEAVRISTERAKSREAAPVTETHRAKTEGLGAKPEGTVAEGEAPFPSPTPDAGASRGE